MIPLLVIAHDDPAERLDLYLDHVLPIRATR